MNGKMGEWIDSMVDGRVNWWKNGCVDEKMDGRMDGWLDQ